MKTASRMNQVLPSSTLAITAKAKELRAQGCPVISLAAGEPDFEMPRQAVQAVIDALNAGLTRYTPTSGTPELKNAVIQKFKRDQGLSFDLNQVVISCGAKHSIYNLMQVLCDPGDEVLLPKPYWVSYPEMVKMAGGTCVYADLSNYQFRMTAEAVKKALTKKTKIILLNSPSNPTGTVIPEKELKEIAAIIEDRDLYCISDEIYEYYHFDGIRHHSIIEYMKDGLERVAIVNGASKSYGMTGLRIGYTIARPDIVKKIGMLQDHSTSNPVSLSQKAAIAALQLGADYQRNLVQTFEKKRDLILDLLKPIQELDAIRPEGSFYVFVSTKKTGMSPNEFSKKLLEDKYVAVIPGEGFGSDDCVRISFAASVENIKEGVSRMTDWLKERPK